MLKIRLLYFFMLPGIILAPGNIAMAQGKPCKFDPQTLQFSGKPAEQARCLLRPNKMGGSLGEELKKLPNPLDGLIGEKIKVSLKVKLLKYLQKNNIDHGTLGGNLNDPLAKSKLPDGKEIPSLFFIIHDTSTPNYEEKPIPPEINESIWKYNKLEMWRKTPVAHVFVNRLGESITTTPFSEPVKQGWGTKFARDYLKADAKGLQLHIELIQPRRANPAFPKGNDAFAPEPGFTDSQYERLALLYFCASARRGSWLIPAYHSAMDEGIKGKHDDPQNFDLAKFAKSIDTLIKNVK